MGNRHDIGDVVFVEANAYNVPLLKVEIVEVDDVGYTGKVLEGTLSHTLFKMRGQHWFFSTNIIEKTPVQPKVIFDDNLFSI